MWLLPVTGRVPALRMAFAAAGADSSEEAMSSKDGSATDNKGDGELPKRDYRS